MSATPADGPASSLDPLPAAASLAVGCDDSARHALGAVAGVVELGAASLGAAAGVLVAGILFEAGGWNHASACLPAVAVVGSVLGLAAVLASVIVVLREIGASAAARWHVLVLVLAAFAGLGTALSPLRTTNALGGPISAALATAALAGAVLLCPAAGQASADPTSTPAPPAGPAS